jgi:hypothetical protein
MRLSTSTGVVGQGASVATHARIQDFDEMDRAALGAASRQRAEDTARLTSNAEHAFRQLRGRTSPEKADRERRVAGQARASSANASAVEPGPPVADLLARGKQAEADGKKALALTYFRVAAGRGSSEAAAAVDRLNPPAKRRMASVTP